MRMATLVLAMMAVAGCSLVGPAASASGPSTAPATASAAASSTAGASEAPAASQTAPPMPTPTRTPSPTPRPPEPTGEDVTSTPPQGLLSADGDPVAGTLSTYCYGNVCVDFPGPPRKRHMPLLPAAAGATMAFTLSGGVAFFRWQATYHERPVTHAPIVLGEGGSEYDFDTDTTPPPELRQVSLAAPPIGDWVVVMYLRFAEGGDANYYWHVVVE